MHHGRNRVTIQTWASPLGCRTIPAQIEAASLVLLNKTDLYSSCLVEETEATIRGIHPTVPIERTSYCRTEVDVFGKRPSVAAHGELGGVWIPTT